MLVSRYDLLVVHHLGHGITRGVMDLERPFLGRFVPDLQHSQLESSDTATSTAVLESEKLDAEQDVILKKNELLPPE